MHYLKRIKWTITTKSDDKHMFRGARAITQTGRRGKGMWVRFHEAVVLQLGSWFMKKNAKVITAKEI